MAVAKAVADVTGKVLAFGVGGQEVAILLGWKVVVGVNFAATKTQIERELGRNVCGRREDA